MRELNRQYLARLRDTDTEGHGRLCEFGHPAKFDPEGEVWVCITRECLEAEDDD